VFRDNFHSPVRVAQYGFLVLIDAEEGTSIDLIKDHIANACTWVEGCGRTDVEYMGEIPEEEDVNE
jgi:hypothetical protein